MTTLEKAIDRCFDKCNLDGSDCDIYRRMYQYKAIRDLPEDEFETVYENLAERLGFAR